MTSTKERDAADDTAAAVIGENGDELDPTNNEPEDIPIRVDPLPQQSASPSDIDKGLRLIQLCRDDSVLAVETNVSEGSPAGFISKTGWTPLAAAAFSGKTEIVSYLLEIGADAMYKTSRRSATAGGHATAHASTSSYATNKPSCGVNTPLHWASYKGHVDVLALLLHAGFSLEDVDPIGNRCLHLASASGHREAVELLLAHSASVEPRNAFGNRALDLATDASCHKLLSKVERQSTCEWCKEAFTRIRRPSLCQHCHNVFCDARPCSSFLESSPVEAAIDNSDGDGSSSSSARLPHRVVRFCQECATEMGKAEQDLRSLLDAKLELIRHTLSALNRMSDDDASKAISRPGSRLGQTDSDAPSSQDGNDAAAATDPSSACEDGVAVSGSTSRLPTPTTSNDAASSSSASVGSEATVSDELLASPLTTLQSNDALSNDRATTAAGGTARRRMVTNDEMARALTLSQTDAEALYTAIEAAQAKAADHALIRRAKRTYHQLVAHVALQDEIKSLMVVRPIGVRSLVASLTAALQLAQREHVSAPMLALAVQVIRSAEAECTLFGCHALCAKIERGTKTHQQSIARLGASICEAQALGASDKLLAAASALRDRLNAEIALEACLVPFTATTRAAAETGAEVTQFTFSDGAVALSLLQALELRAQKITAAVDVGASVDGVSTALLDDAATALKQLKKDIRDETKNEDERRRLEEEAAAKAAKKTKKKKKA